MRVQTFSRMQIMQEFQLRCQTLAANENRGFKQEFEELNEVGKDLSTKAGDSEANREKNRYPYILPYDHCRVRLSIQNSFPHSDYINANFVPGGGSERDFICTQGPLHSTMADFWRMVWEQNVRIIVMVTALRHKDMVLCDKYWPLEKGTVYHGLIQVTTVTRKQGPDYFITTINLRQRDCSTDRIITHYYYPSWPDRGVPREPFSLCAFTEHVRQHLEAIPRLGPSVVHCSAGVGRSGTFVALLWLMQLCVRGIRPDVRAAVEDLRLHRMWMVQNLAIMRGGRSPSVLTCFSSCYYSLVKTQPCKQLKPNATNYDYEEQYIFVHQCLLYWLKGGSSASSLQIHGATSNITHAQDSHSSSRTGDRAGRRRHHHHHRECPPPDQPPSTMQQMFHPRMLLRRILPSSSLFHSGSHTS